MQNPRYAAEFEQVVALAESRNVAVQTIKSITRRPWPTEGDHAHTTWYEPLTEQSEIDLAVHWVLGRPGVFLNTVGDIHLLPKVLDAAARFKERPSDEVMQAQVERLSIAPLFV